MFAAVYSTSPLVASGFVVWRHWDVGVVFVFGGDVCEEGDEGDGERGEGLHGGEKKECGV